MKQFIFKSKTKKHSSKKRKPLRLHAKSQVVMSHECEGSQDYQQYEDLNTTTSTGQRKGFDCEGLEVIMDEYDDHQEIQKHEDFEDSNPTTTSTTEQYKDFNCERQKICCILESLGMMNHFGSGIGGFKTDQSAKAIVQRSAEFIAWCSKNNNSVIDVELNKDNLADIFLTLLTKNFTLLRDFCVQWLEVARQLKPTTIIHYLNSLLLGAKWVDYYFLGNKVIVNLAPLLDVSKTLKR